MRKQAGDYKEFDEASLKKLLQNGENEKLECKAGIQSLPKSLWETYSAFANTSGGIILLGIQEDTKENDPNKRFTIQGVNHPEARLKEFWDALHSDKVSDNILSPDQAGIMMVDGKNIIWIQIPAAEYTRKPVFIHGNPFKGTFKRSFEVDYRCSEKEVRNMLRDSTEASDGQILQGSTMDDIDLASLQAYRRLFGYRNPDHVWNQADDQAFLQNLQAYKKDCGSGQEGLTVAGLLMFGKSPSVLEAFPALRMDYIDRSGLLPGERWSDRLTYDGTWENNLYQFASIVIPRLTIDLKRPFRLEGMVRQDDTPVHRSVREAMINMLVHADYHLGGNLRAEKLDDGFCFSNPGTLLLPADEICQGAHSLARNPILQTMFRMIGYGEDIGSGFSTILDAWSGQHWCRPEILEDAANHTVKVYLSMIRQLDPEQTDRDQLSNAQTDQKKEACHFPDQTKFSEGMNIAEIGSQYQLSREEQMILEIASRTGEVSIAKLRPVMPYSVPALAKFLNQLADKGLLEVHRYKNWTNYVLSHQAEPIHLPDDE